MSTAADMKNTALLPWFGSKRNLAPMIVDELGRHTCYWEPFCGSMAVLLIKPAVSQETVNDLHGDLINLARVIQDPRLGPQLYRRCRRVFACREFMEESAARFRARGNMPASESPDLERAYDYFVCSWLGRNGVAGTQSFNQGFSRRFTKNGGHSGTRWASAVDSIPEWRKRMRRVTILSEDAIGLIERIEDAAGIAIYCDPPYLAETRSSGAGFGRGHGSSKYIHDFDAADHERLAAALRRFQHARVVVSYYDHPDLERLYPSWTQRRIVVTKAMASQGVRARNDVRVTEVLLLNGSSYAQGTGRLF